MSDERKIDAVLMEALATFESALIVYVDNQYDEDDGVGIAQEITLRGNLYTSLGILREVADEASAQLRRERYRAEVNLKRALEAEKKIAQIRNAAK